VTPRRGRPHKFSVPARPVTLTLPEHVIETLLALDADLGRAVVRLAQPAIAQQPRPAAELVTYGRHSVIVITPSRSLRRLRGVQLVPLPDGRALISIDRPTTIAELELLIEDTLDTEGLASGDRTVFRAIADILKTARRSDKILVLQRSIIVLEAQPRRDASLRGRRLPTRRASPGSTPGGAHRAPETRQPRPTVTAQVRRKG
jgi:hypothetical protein